MEFTKYNAKNGMIACVITCDQDMLTPDDFPNIPGAYNQDAYFVNIKAVPPKAQKRPKMKISQSATRIKADGVEVVKLSKLPKPCAVLVNGFEYEVKDGVFEWGTRLPGVYIVRVVAFPFLDWEGTVTAV